MGMTAAERKKKHDETHKKIVFWMEEDDYNKVKADAELAGLTLSDYLRRLALNKPLPNPADLAIRDSVAQLMKLGGLMKHLNMQLRTAQDPDKLKTAMQKHDSIYSQLLTAITRLMK